MSRSLLPKVHDVLHGRVAADADTLLRLIRDHNPTGRDLPREEAARLYGLKSRLQSLLIRRFGAALRFRRDGHEAVVTIDHGRGPDTRSAGHARLDALDEDARAFVQRRLDEQDPPEAPPAAAAVGTIAVCRRAAARAARRAAPAPSGPQPDAHLPGPEEDDPEALLLAGRAALAAYDYDAARHHLQRALFRSGGAPGPAVELLTVLVDCLGADGEALTLLPALSPQAQDDPAARRLLATAAARQGEADLALRLARGLPGPQAAPILAALCRAALQRGDDPLDLDQAERLLAEARAAAPCDADLLSLEQDLRRRREAARGPLEQALLHLFEMGTEEEAEAAARALLDRFPDSRAAGRVLRALAERRAERTAKDLLGQAQALMAQGDQGGDGAPRRAAALLQQALGALFRDAAHDGLRRRLKELLHLAETAARAQAEAAALAHALDLLRAPDEAALAHYAALEPHLRAQVRARCDWQALSWLDQLAAERPAGPAQALAVLALDRAMQRLGAPQEALGLLVSHERVLAQLPAARALLAELRREIGKQQQQQARLALAAVRALVEEQGLPPPEIDRRFREIDARALGPEDRRDYEELREAVDSMQEQWLLWTEIDRLEAAGAYLDARALLDELFEMTGPEPAPPEWVARREQLDRNVFDHFAIRTSDEIGPPDELRDLNLGEAARGGLQRWVLPSGEVFLATDAGAVLLLRVLDPERGVVVRRATLWSNGHLDLQRVVVTAAGVWLLGNKGLMLIDPLTFRILRRHAMKDLMPGDRPPNGVTVTPDGETLWLMLDLPGRNPLYSTLADANDVWTVDARRPKTSRHVGERGTPHAVAWQGEQAMFCTRDRGTRERGGAGVLTARGATLRSYDGFPTLCDVRTVAPGPGAGLLVFYATFGVLVGEARQYGDRNLHCTRLLPGAEAGPGQVLPGWAGDKYTAAVTLPGPGGERRCFLRARRLPPCTGPEHGLLVVGASSAPEGPPVVLHEAPLPAHTVLAVDAEARRAILMAPAGGGISAVPLSAAGPPADRPLGEGDRDEPPPDPINVSVCRMQQLQAGGIQKLLEELKRVGEAAGGGYVRDFFRQHIDDPERLMDLLQVVSTLGNMPYLDAVITRVRKAFPDHPRVRFFEAEILGSKNWARVLELLRDVRPEQLAHELAQHLLHLRSLALAYTGAHEEARAELARAQELGGTCLMQPLARALAPLPADWRTDDCFITSDRPEWRLAGLLRAADALLGQGDHEGVTALLDDRFVWACGDRQHLGRLCHAWLQLEPQGEVQRFRKVLAVSRFHARWVNKVQGLPYPDHAWDEVRLKQVDGAALAWLNNVVRLQRVPAPTPAPAGP